MPGCRIPAPAVFLVGAAAASDLFPALGGVGLDVAEQVVTVALIMILFDGGMGIGLRRFRAAVTPILVVGVLGTLLTAAAMALLAHLLFGLAWPLALLLGTALAPTDPAVAIGAFVLGASTLPYVWSVFRSYRYERVVTVDDR